MSGTISRLEHLSICVISSAKTDRTVRTRNKVCYHLISGMKGVNYSKLMFAMCDLFQVRTRIKLRLDDKILSIDVGELDDLFTADVMSDVIEESTKEALEIEPESGGLGTSEKTSGQKSNEPDQSTTEKGIENIKRNKFRKIKSSCNLDFSTLFQSHRQTE